MKRMALLGLSLLAMGVYAEKPADFSGLEQPRMVDVAREKAPVKAEGESAKKDVDHFELTDSTVMRWIERPDLYTLSLLLEATTPNIYRVWIETVKIKQDMAIEHDLSALIAEHKETNRLLRKITGESHENE